MKEELFLSSLIPPADSFGTFSPRDCFIRNDERNDALRRSPSLPRHRTRHARLTRAGSRLHVHTPPRLGSARAVPRPAVSRPPVRGGLADGPPRRRPLRGHRSGAGRDIALAVEPAAAAAEARLARPAPDAVRRGVQPRRPR